MFYETLNALRYSEVYDENELAMIADSLSKYGFDVWEPRGEVYRETARLSLKHAITVYDASYATLADHLQVPFYTADGKLLEKFPRTGRHIRTFKELGRIFGADKGRVKSFSEDDRGEDR